MKITYEKVDYAALGACLALRFLFHPKAQKASRNQMPDLSDSAIFHRLWNLVGLVDPATGSQLNADETEALEKFLQCYNSLQWHPLSGHPHISELRDDDLSSLTSAGESLYGHLIRRQNISVWKRLSLKLQGW